MTGRFVAARLAVALIGVLLGAIAPASAQDVPAEARGRVLVVGTKEAPPFAMKEPDGSWTGLGIAVPRYAKFDWLRLLGSLLSTGFLEALGGLFGLTMLVGVVIWLLERRHTEHFGGGKQGFVTGIWWSALTLAQTRRTTRRRRFPGESSPGCGFPPPSR